MNESKKLEEKFHKFQKEIKNERMFLFKLNSLFTDEYEENIDDILILNEKEFISHLKNGVEQQLEDLYSEKCFSDKKFKNYFERALNNINTDYKSDYNLIFDVYNNYSKNKNLRKNNFEFLNSNYRRHCINEMRNDHATHNCNSENNKFLLVKRNNNSEFVICINCKKVYYSTYILCKCYKCNKEYYTEILPKEENEFLLPATWEEYHCKQIVNEKMKCIKCQETLYLNMKIEMLQCLNKKCKFTSKPSKILWTCSICQTDFKSSAIPYNNLELEAIKKIINQALIQKHKAHPDKIPCCKLNVFFTDFYHNNKCDGILYTGELNDDVIIVCEKCHKINFYDRFIWTCPKCGKKFKYDKSNINEDYTDSDKEKEKNLINSKIELKKIISDHSFKGFHSASFIFTFY